MIGIKDVTTAFSVWIAAGMKPPPENNRDLIAEKTLQQYCYTSIEDWAEAVDYIANNNTRWATWFDINNALSIVRQNKVGEEKKAIERSSKGSSEVMKKLFADLASGRTFAELKKPPSEKIVKTAKRLFPDCSDKFIGENIANLDFIADVDRKCAGCIRTTECPWNGHQPFLIIDKTGGFTVLLADSNKCYKYQPLIPTGTKASLPSAQRGGEMTKV